MVVGVFVYDDDATPWEFVESIFQQIFDKPRDEARELMLETHCKGSALCGLYAAEHAAKLMAQARNAAERSGYPLQFDTRPVDNGEPSHKISN